jgi:hypothetical protein
MARPIRPVQMPDRAERTDYIGYANRLDDVCTRLSAAGYSALSLETERLLESYRALHRRTIEAVHERKVLGVYVYARLPGAVRQPVGLWTARKTIFFILHEPRSKSGKLAFKFFNQIKSTMDL